MGLKPKIVNLKLYSNPSTVIKTYHKPYSLVQTLLRPLYIRTFTLQLHKENLNLLSVCGDKTNHALNHMGASYITVDLA